VQEVGGGPRARAGVVDEHHGRERKAKKPFCGTAFRRE
jgi:hypothetical protein